MPSNPDVTGILLVGGRSSRMGKDKAFLPFRGAPIFETVLNVLKVNMEKVLLVGDRPERFAAYGLTVLPDIYPGSALGGLYTGLHAADTPYIFASPCDLPFASPEVLAYMLALRSGYDAVVPMTGEHPEPLFALYSKNCLEPIRDLLETRNYRVYDFFPRVRVRRVVESELSSAADFGRIFRNVNTEEEYHRLLEESKNDR